MVISYNILFLKDNLLGYGDRENFVTISLSKDMLERHVSKLSA